MTNESMVESAEIMLARYLETRDKALRDRIVERHLYIAGIVARRFSGKGVDYDDLYQVASLAMVKAIERFDPDKGVKFVSFATPTMMGEVKNYFRDKSRLITVPRRGTAVIKRFEQAREKLEQLLLRAPTLPELAEEMDVPLETVLEALEMRGAISPASLDTAPPDSEDSPVSAFIGQSEEGYALFERRDQLGRALEKLSAEEKDVVVQRFFDNKSQREIAEGLGVSQMTVSRIERRALEKIRGNLSEEGNSN